MASSLAMLAALVSLLAWHATAHSCDSGARVTCMEVQTMEGAPSTFGESYDAHGTALCTPSGEKVFCLVDHDYHRCRPGEVPCCSDGSNPRHRHDVGTSGGKNVTCKPRGVSSMVTSQGGSAPARLPPSNSVVQVILDDEDPSNKMNTFTHAGSYQPCMKDAYKGQFHHDWATNKGSAHLTYHVDPPRDGCYLLEEYHPGGDEMCARYLPSNARMDLTFGRGLSESFLINQGRNGAQWNPLAKVPFYKSSNGTITMRNAPGEQCRDSSCFWVADAFRLTWVEDSCSIDGNLLMQARLSDSITADDVLQKLEQNKDALERAFADYFGYQAVHLVDIINTGRRLLEGDLGTAKLAASLMVFGTPQMTTAGDLSQVLQKALSDVGAGLYIESAEVDWTSEPAGPAGPTEPVGSFPSQGEQRQKQRPSDDADDDDDKQPLTIILVLVGIAALLISCIVGGFVLRSTAKLSAEKKAAKSTVCPEVQDLEGAEVKSDKGKGENDDKMEIESVSTATPSSEPKVSPQNSICKDSSNDDLVI